MNSLELTLRGVLAGEGAATAAVLHNCRFDGAGSSVYGREAILDLFRSTPMALDNARLVAGARFAALFGSSAGNSVALFADIYAGNIARLRFLGPVCLARRSAARIDVPYDPALGQHAALVAFEPNDHPELPPEHRARVLTAAERFSEHRCADDAALARASAQLVRMRSFVLRAFSSGREAAMLLMVAALRSDGRAGLVQFAAAAWLPSDAPQDGTVVVDEGECAAALMRDWQPTL